MTATLIPALAQTENDAIRHLEEATRAVNEIATTRFEDAIHAFRLAVEGAKDRLGGGRELIGDLAGDLMTTLTMLAGDLAIGRVENLPPVESAGPLTTAALAAAKEEAIELPSSTIIDDEPAAPAPEPKQTREWPEGDALPELTEEEANAMNALPPDFIERIIRGERPLGDPETVTAAANPPVEPPAANGKKKRRR